MTSGFFIGGPSNMISSAISADLGRQELIQGSSEALATVTGIVDGTGSIGAAVGQVREQGRAWHGVFSCPSAVEEFTPALWVTVGWHSCAVVHCTESLGFLVSEVQLMWPHVEGHSTFISSFFPLLPPDSSCLERS